MENTFWITMSAGAVACLITTIGIYVISKFADWGKKHIIYFMSFAAGILISVSFMHIIPEAFEMSTYAPVFLLAGFLSLHLFNRFLHTYVCSKEGKKHYHIGLIPAFGIALHSFLDGVIYSVTFSVGVFTGVLAVVGMIFHEFPEGIVTYLFLSKSGFSKKKSIFYAFLAAAITTPLGALVSYPFVSNLTPQILGSCLAFSAGVLIYVGATHLLPKVEEAHGRYTFLSLTAGIIVAVIIVMSHAH